MNLKIMTAGSLVAGLLLIATPAFADHNGSGKDGNGNNGWHFGAFVAALPHLNVGLTGSGFVNADRINGKSGTSTAMKDHPFASSTIEIGVIGSVNGSMITLDPAIDLNGTSSASTNVVTNASTTFKGGATSTASLTSGEKVVIVGTTSTSTPGTITASFVIALKNAWHFCTHLLSR